MCAMSTNKDINADEKDNEYNNARTYVFPKSEDMHLVDGRSKTWQIFPSLCGCLVCFIFGITLGWPSPIYPKLFEETSPIPITYDQSALIAGFLMIGNIFATPLSNYSPFGTKYGILISLIVMLLGWLVMWQTENFYGLLCSRFLVGFGNGHGVAQVKQYIKDLCEKNLGKTLCKLLNLFTIFGLIVAFSFGPFVTFQIYSIVSLCIVIVVVFVCMFLPHTPVELIKFGQTKEAQVLVQYLKANSNIEVSIPSDIEDMNILQIIRNKTLRNNLFLLFCVTFFQQFSGPPATIVYCQIILTKFGCPNPELFSIVYATLYLISNIVGYFYMYKFNMKYSLLFSSFATGILLTLNVFLIYFNLNAEWPYSSFVALCCFVCFHSIGLGCLPFALTEKIFPKFALKVATQFQIIVYSASAIIVTKLFQVLFTNFSFYVPFVMFDVVSIASVVFVSVFIPHTFPVLC